MVQPVLANIGQYLWCVLAGVTAGYRYPRIPATPAVNTGSCLLDTVGCLCSVLGFVAGYRQVSQSDTNINQS